MSWSDFIAVTGQFFKFCNALQWRDGKGYKMVADAIIKIDKFNPQIASRLLGTFKGWRQMEPRRAARARAQLQRIAKLKKLSRDSYEIVTRTLD